MGSLLSQTGHQGSQQPTGRCKGQALLPRRRSAARRVWRTSYQHTHSPGPPRGTPAWPAACGSVWCPGACEEDEGFTLGCRLVEGSPVHEALNSCDAGPEAPLTRALTREALSSQWSIL
eukprot:XP_001705187.1 Hypothetical protein GL50803_95432 [Giardia lamblia ATCC 50803]